MRKRKSFVFRGGYFDLSILVRLVINLVVYEIEIMVGDYFILGSCY